MRLVVAITGASGAIYGVRLLEALHSRPGVETLLVVSAAAQAIVPQETGRALAEVQALATRTFDNGDLAAPIASGSFHTDGMVVAPCSIKTLSALANSYAETLIARAGDVALKERRRLILLVRETPLHAGHLRLMLALAELGAVIMPPIPTFYGQPKTIDDLVNHTIGRVLDHLGLEHDLYRPWLGCSEA
ncbi:MAG TPA: UbiX family flavin prenyltransferase [Anaerolineae bacterium]|nr:UbiX family flavin prenyltransferase [Anaerolineae bacterium]HOR00877.1 UbiX family flavin prenyltransferase [Anaerolineae bacterium]HPL29204.1 UbiX family flavin prenyltransferase [Anaerolineae bacterium]